MEYVIVRTKGPDADYVITTNYADAIRVYRRWLTDYLAQTHDPHAREHLDRIAGAGDQLYGPALLYRSLHHPGSPLTQQVFALSVLAWPAIWKLPPPHDIDRDWGRTIRQIPDPRGVYELRTDGVHWRIFWLDDRYEAAFATTSAYTSAAEAAADFTFLEANLKQLHPSTPQHNP